MKLFRIGLVIEDLMGENTFKSVFDMREVCKDKKKVEAILENFMKQAKRFLKENGTIQKK